MPEYRTRFDFKHKREHIAKVIMPNLVYPNQHIETEVSHGSRYHVIVPDTVNVTFNLDVKSTDKTHSIVNPLSVNLAKWLKTVKQLIGCCQLIV